MDADDGEERPQVGTLEELRRVLAGFETAMLVTHSPDGLVRARPMALQDPAAVSDADLWFATADDSAKADEIREDRQVNVCCLGQGGAYVSIAARARIDHNPSEVKRLWKA